MRNFGITGVGMYVPDKVLTNEEIESWGIGTSDKWIFENSGIKERRIVAEDQMSSDLAEHAAREAMENANVNPDEIDLIVVSTLTPDFLLPQTSSIVKRKIGAVNAACFDVQAACAGFVFAVINGVNYAILNQEVNNILVIGVDTVSKATDWSDRKLCSVIGDGAGAFVIQKMEGLYGIRSSYIYSEAMESPDLGCIPAKYGRIEADTSVFYNFSGRHLYEKGKELLLKAVIETLRKVKWETDEVKLFMFPQSNINLMIEMSKLLNIPVEKTHAIMYSYGYTFNSCLSMAIYDAVKCKKLATGDKVILVGSGAGFHSAGIALEWAY